MRHKFHVKSSSGVLKNFFSIICHLAGEKMSRNERFPQDIFKTSLCQMKYFHHNFPPSLKLSMAENIFAHFTDEMFNFPSNHQSGCFSKRKNCLRTRRGCAWDKIFFYFSLLARVWGALNEFPPSLWKFNTFISWLSKNKIEFKEYILQCTNIIMTCKWILQISSVKEKRARKPLNKKMLWRLPLAYHATPISCSRCGLWFKLQSRRAGVWRLFFHSGFLCINQYHRACFSVAP